MAARRTRILSFEHASARPDPNFLFSAQGLGSNRRAPLHSDVMDLSTGSFSSIAMIGALHSESPKHETLNNHISPFMGSMHKLCAIFGCAVVLRLKPESFQQEFCSLPSTDMAKDCPRKLAIQSHATSFADRARQRRPEAMKFSFLLVVVPSPSLTSTRLSMGSRCGNAINTFDCSSTYRNAWHMIHVFDTGFHQSRG